MKILVNEVIQDAMDHCEINQAVNIVTIKKKIE